MRSVVKTHQRLIMCKVPSSRDVILHVVSDIDKVMLKNKKNEEEGKTRKINYLHFILYTQTQTRKLINAFLDRLSQELIKTMFRLPGK